MYLPLYNKDKEEILENKQMGYKHPDEKKVAVCIKITKWKIDDMRKRSIPQGETFEELYTEKYKPVKPDHLKR